MAGCAPESSTQPNIIVFYADDMGLGDIRAYDPASTIPTPSFDRLAREGMRFTDAHSAASICTPSRYALLTGRYPFRTRDYNSVLRSTYDEPLLDACHETLAGMLQRVGYRTAGFGKWHLGMTFTNETGDGPAQAGIGTSQFSTTDGDFSKPILDGPLQHGFDYYFGLGSSINHGPYAFVENDRVVEQPERIRPQLNTPGGHFREGWIAPSWHDDGQGKAISAKALDFMRDHLTENREQPFFVFFAATANHTPYAPPEEISGYPIRGSGGADDGFPLRNDMIVENDVILGLFLDLLDDPDQDGDSADSAAANTLVIVASDNGADRGFYRSIRDKKTSIYEGGHRTPFIVRWPERVAADGECGWLIGQVDLFATLAMLVETRIKDGSAEDSHAMPEALLACDGSAPARTPLLQQALGGGDVFALRDDPWKLIIDAGEPRELYNLADDLAETTDLASQHPEIVEAMAAKFGDIVEP